MQQGQITWLNWPLTDPDQKILTKNGEVNSNGDICNETVDLWEQFPDTQAHYCAVTTTIACTRAGLEIAIFLTCVACKLGLG